MWTGIIKMCISPAISQSHSLIIASVDILSFIFFHFGDLVTLKSITFQNSSVFRQPEVRHGNMAYFQPILDFKIRDLNKAKHVE